ncbi:MAG: hypothetical protein JSW55_17815 [Chloroflexota bacterium]|nr:MAG: hypothetical protein JSW55_17815 [Chloroflexota bacterium]
MLATIKGTRLLALLIFGAAVFAACRAESPEVTPSPTLTPRGTVGATTTNQPAFTPTIAPTVTPTESPTSTQTPKPTATFEPAATIEPTPELEAQALPEGWRELGNERLGLQIAAPADWIDMSDQARAAGWHDGFGPQVLLLADSQQSGENVISGQPAIGGGFVLGFVSEDITPSPDAAASLLAFLGESAQEESLIFQRLALDSSDLLAAYVDLDSIASRHFTSESQQLTFRLLSVVDPEQAVQTFFLMGADRENWELYRDRFEQMTHTINLSANMPVVGQQLMSGDQVKGELSHDANQLWPFNSRGGQYATITLAPEDGIIDLTLVLIDPDGNILASIDSGYAGDLEVLTDVLLPDEGTYIVEASEFFREGGQYQLSLTLADEPQFGGGGRIEIGGEIDSELPENGEHIWVFGGTAGQEVSIVLTSASGQLDVILVVVGPDGQEELVLDEGFAGDAEVATGLALPVTGDYKIMIRGFAGRGGPYTLALGEGSESTVNFYDAGDLAFGQTGREFLQQDEAHAWFFEGLTGDQVTIEVSPSGENLDLEIWLLDPQLNDVATRDEFLAGEPEKIEEHLPGEGQYLILVREFFGEPGEYEIRLSAGGDDLLEIAGSITYSETVSGTFPSDQNVGWSFQALAGEIINIALTPTDLDRDLVIVLLNPQGETATSVDAALSGLPERLSSYRITEDGEWMILIQEFFNEGSGYELTLTRQQ